MELSAGASDVKKEIGLDNVRTLMNKAHAIRCPGATLLMKATEMIAMFVER